MNGRQAARAAAQKIEELEYANKQYAHEIRLFYETVGHMIRHGSPCDYCEDREACREAGKDLTIGCDEWFLDSGIILPGEAEPVLTMTAERIDNES